MSETTSRIDAARRAVENAASDGKERRVAQIDHVETRGSDDGSWTFEGHAAVFDSLSENLGGMLGGFREVLKRGAFKDPIEHDDVRMLFNHNPDKVLARNTSGTLKLSEDPKGLRTIADISGEVSYARDLRELLKRRDVSQMSFGFRMGDGAEQEFHEDKDGNVTRTIHKIGELFDVSPVTFPAYTATDAKARSVCGVEIFDGEDLDLERVRSLAWKVHRGDVVATVDERRHIDALLEGCSSVSPWIAERTLLAVASEPELLAAVPGKRARVELTQDNDAPAFRLAAAQRRLRARAHLVR